MYECPRCQHLSKQKNHLLRHFQRKYLCIFIEKDISVEECILLLNKGELKIKSCKKTHECYYCNQSFDREFRLQNHIFKCKEKTLIVELVKKQQEKIENIAKKQKPIKHEPFLQFVYLLQEREFFRSGENIFKIGKTTRPSERIKGYPKGSILFLNLPCGNCDVMEKKLIKHFDENFVHKGEIGREYYEGELSELIIEFINVLKKNKLKINSNE